MREIKIEDYEETCPFCKGWGEIYRNDSICSCIVCKICEGKGKIDWIDKIKIRRNNEKRLNRK